MKASKILLAGLLATIGSVATAQVVDGSITSGEYGTALATQTVQTQFGDNNNADAKGANGSELNQLFASNDEDNLYIGLTGNAETNGNQVQILIEVVGGAAGVNVIPAGGFGAINGLTLPTGFAPQFFLSPNAGNGATQDIFMNIHRLTGGAVNSQFLGNAAGDATPGTPTIGSIVADLTHWTYVGKETATFLLALDNSNTAGVEGGNAAATGDPTTVTTGLEVGIPLEILEEVNGAPLTTGTQVRLLAVVTSGGSADFLSNQVLPPVTPAGNLGSSGTANLQTAGGSAATYTLDFSASVGDWMMMAD